jgi:hypothetical protein
MSAVAPAPAPAYRVRHGDVAADHEAVLAVWRGNLGVEARMARKYAWFYASAPQGAPLLEMLVHGEDAVPVGTCSAGRRSMRLGEQVLRAGVLVDLAVTPEHRSLGPALMLQQGLFATGREQLDLLYGFPNPKAVPVFKRIGYRALAQMERHVRVVRHAPYLARRMPAPLAALAGAAVDAGHALARALRTRWRATWHDRVPDIAPIWSIAPRPEALTAERTPEYLRWRFDDAPDGGFRHLVLADRSGMAAWFATRREDHVLHVHDFWTRDGACPSRAHLDGLLAAARRDGAAAVSIELASIGSLLQPWREAGFTVRSARPLFGWCAFASGDAAVPLHLVSADEDE